MDRAGMAELPLSSGRGNGCLGSGGGGGGS